MTESSDSGLGAAEPELCRVSVIGGNTQIDLGLPSSVPIAAFIADLVGLVESRNTDAASDADVSRPRHWTLARLGREPISPSQTLAEAEVFDGELLVLRSLTAKEPPALFDDVFGAVARLTAESFRGWSPQAARWMGLVVAIVAVVVAVGLLAATRGAGGGVVAAALPVVVGIGALVAAAISARRYAASQGPAVLSLCAMLLIFVGTALFVPDDLGSPHLLLGSVAVLVVAVVAHRVIAVGATVFAAAMTLAVFAAVAAAVQTLWDPAVSKVAAGVVVAAITAISVTPRLAAVFAGLSVRSDTAAGDAVDDEPAVVVDGIDAVAAVALPSTVGIGERARTANRYQSGGIFACTTAAAVAAVCASDPTGSGRWPGIALGVVVALVLCLRGRSFADLGQACTLIGGGCATFVAVTVGAALGDSTALVGAACALLVFAAVATAFGAAGPHTDASPMVLRAVEIIEYLLILLIIPLAFWTMDLYSAARDI